jgi:putative endonuclease
MLAKGGWVYILSSHSRCFFRKYKINQLVYHEFFTDIESAITREKQLKGWTRAKKIMLIEKMNATWEDLTLPDLR